MCSLNMLTTTRAKWWTKTIVGAVVYLSLYFVQGLIEDYGWLQRGTQRDRPVVSTFFL